MKKTLTRILAVFAIAMMLIPAFATLAAHADGELEETIDISDIVNLYKLDKLDAAPTMSKTAGAIENAEPTEENGVLASEPFEVTSDGSTYLYVGPCPDPRINYGKALDYIAYWYKPNGAYTSQKKFAELGNGDENIVDEFSDGSVILRIKIRKQSNPIKSTEHKYAALKLPVTSYSDYILATCGRPFTVEEYFAYADAQGWNLDGTALRPAPPEVAEDPPEGYEGLWNYFPIDKDFEAPSTQKEATNQYVNSAYIPVVEGDVITIGAISTKETQTILYEYSDEQVPGANTGGTVTLDYKLIKQYKKGDIGVDFKENIGYDYAIYAYTVPAGVSFIKVRVPESTCANGDVLVTKNQEFKGAQLREALEIPELSNDAQNHDFNGKNALFVGDSIFLGEYDTPSSYSTPTTSFARRLALATGLIPTVYAANGATIAKTGKSNVKYAYDLLKTALMSKKNYDMIIFQGGIGDARNDIAVGEILPLGTEREVLAERERTATFAGALQLMFYDALNKWTDAEFYFVASYKTIPETVNEKDMAAYYAQAKALCEMYGIHYIDLYNDTEINTIFNYANPEEEPDKFAEQVAEWFVDDKFTPNSATYDLLSASVLRLFNASLSEKLVNPFAPQEENNTNNNDNNNTQNTPVTDNDSDSKDGLGIGVIIAIAAAGVVVLAGGGFALYWFVIRKKAVKKTADVKAPEAESKNATEENKNNED